MRPSFRAILFLIAAIALLAACVTPEELDWRWRTATLDMRPPVGPDAIGSLTVAGRVDATAFTDDALWALVAVPTRRSLPVNRVVRIDLASNRFNDLFAVDGFAAGAMAAGHDAIWVAEGHGGTQVHRIDPRTQRIVASFAFPRNPVALAVDDNAVWVIAASEAPRRAGILLRVDGLALSRIDPVANAIVETIPLPVPDARGLTSGSIATTAGAVWIATPAGEVVRVDPRTKRIVASLPLPGGNHGRRASFQLATSAGGLYLVRQVKERADLPAAWEALRTTAWAIDPGGNRLASEPFQFAGEGVVLFLGEETAWLGSTRVDAIVQAAPGTFRAAAAPLKIGYPVYALTAGRGSLWAFSGARISRGDSRDITWITRVRIAPDPPDTEGDGQSQPREPASDEPRGGPQQIARSL